MVVGVKYLYLHDIMLISLTYKILQVEGYCICCPKNGVLPYFSLDIRRVMKGYVHR